MTPRRDRPRAARGLPVLEPDRRHRQRAQPAVAATEISGTRASPTSSPSTPGRPTGARVCPCTGRGHLDRRLAELIRRPPSRGIGIDESAGPMDPSSRRSHRRPLVRVVTAVVAGIVALNAGLPSLGRPVRGPAVGSPDTVVSQSIPIGSTPIAVVTVRNAAVSWPWSPDRRHLRGRLPATHVDATDGHTGHLTSCTGVIDRADLHRDRRSTGTWRYKVTPSSRLDRA